MRIILIFICNKFANFDGSMITLMHLSLGEKARLISIDSNADKKYRHQLISMGLTPGVELQLKRRAPLGDPVEILVRGFSLGLRQYEAECLQIERI